MLFGKFSRMSRSEDLCKLGEEYLNALTCKFKTFSCQNFETF